MLHHWTLAQHSRNEDLGRVVFLYLCTCDPRPGAHFVRGRVKWQTLTCVVKINHVLVVVKLMVLFPLDVCTCFNILIKLGKQFD